jgi:hypothetical protein
LNEKRTWKWILTLSEGLASERRKRNFCLWCVWICKTLKQDAKKKES